MTTALLDRQAHSRPLTTDEVDELCALTSHLPHLVRGWSTPVPLGLADAAMRLEATVWELACRHHVEVGADSTVFDVVDGLSRHPAWSSAAARDALRAVVMLRWAPPADSDCELLATRSAGRLLGYLELRSRLG